MARHRVPGEEPAERGGISSAVLISTVVALVVFTIGVVWAAVGKPHDSAAPPIGGASALVEPGSTADLASGAVGSARASTMQVVPHGPDVHNPSAGASGAPTTPAAPVTATPDAPQSPRGSQPTKGTGSLIVTARTHSWNGWYYADYTVTNHTSAVVNSWTVTVVFDTRVAYVNAWDVNKHLDGVTVTLTSMRYNSMLQPGASTSFGLQASSGNDATPVPASCTVNGRPCSG